MKTAKKFIVLGADPVKTHGNFILPPIPSYTSHPRAPQTAASSYLFLCAFFVPRIQTYVGAEGAEACRIFPMLLGVGVHTGHILWQCSG